MWPLFGVTGMYIPSGVMLEKHTSMADVRRRTRQHTDRTTKRQVSTNKPTQPRNSEHRASFNVFSFLPVHSLWAIVAVLLPMRLASGLFNPVGDCDETFNYWEPTHYIMYGSGMQTWEYSPTFALRSYFYIILHAGLGKFAQIFFLEHIGGKMAVFFFVRSCLAVLCSVCEAFFVRAVAKPHNFGPTVGQLTLSFLMLSPGMFNASSAFLPQSFTLCCLLMSFAKWMEGPHCFQSAIFFMGTACILGWPFAALLGIPMGLDMLKKVGLASFLRAAVPCALAVSIPSVAADYIFYRKFVFAAWNLAVYNSAVTHGGSTLYGVAPASYYIKNLALNFNLVAPLAVVGTLILSITGARMILKGRLLRQWMFCVAPLTIWLCVMFAMPHKEERFLFVVYHLICLAGAVGTAALGRLVGLFLPSGFALRRYWLFLVACVFTMLSCSRIAALVDNFSAPFSVYRDLHARLMEPHPPSQSLRTDSRVLVCVGKEWYRFPSSFYFPADREDQHVRLAFLKSDFTGQLPRLYEETPNGTSVIPPNMNDENKEEPSRYVAEGDCDYIVDLVLPGQREPDYRAMPHWKELAEYSFLDTDRSPSLVRALYIPGVSRKQNTYASYVLLAHSRSGG